MHGHYINIQLLPALPLRAHGVVYLLSTIFIMSSPPVCNTETYHPVTASDTHHCHVLQVLADDGHVVCVVKQAATVELPARATARRLDLGAGRQVGLPPAVQKADGGGG